MQIRKLVIAGARLLLAPITGAIEGVKTEANRQPAQNWKQFIVDDVRLYFSPITGAIAGVKKEFSRRK